MKTIKEINEHLLKNGYTSRSANRIFNFLSDKIENKEDFEIEFMFGENEFEDFKEWYEKENDSNTTFTDDDFVKGDFIHLKDGLDVLMLSYLFNGEFVCTDGWSLYKMTLTNDTRTCTKEEIEKVEERLHLNGIKFCYDCDELEPLQEQKNDKDVKSEKLNDLDDNYLNGIFSIISDLFGYDYDKIEIEAKEAIENIIANLHDNKMSPSERASLDNALNVLVQLGKMYE